METGTDDVTTLVCVADVGTVSIVPLTGIRQTCNEQYDTRHEKTDLKVFVVVIPKEGWASVAAPIILLVRH